MTSDQWLRSTDDSARTSAKASNKTSAAELHPAATPGTGLMTWLRLFLLRRRINAMLRRNFGPHRSEDARTLPPHLLRDIGLQPPM